MPDTDRPARRESWPQRHWRSLAWAGVGVLIGLVAGFVAGGYLACAPSKSCEFKADLAGALGTWVGGLGTIGALVFAVVAFRSEEAARRRDEQAKIEAEAARQIEAAAARDEARRAREAEEAARRREIERERTDAERVTITAQIGATSGNSMTEFRVYVSNTNNTALVHQVRGVSDDFGGLGFAHTLEPGGVHTQRFRMGAWKPGRGSVELPPDREQYVRDQVEGVTISFEMNDKRWTRTGTGPVELASEDSPSDA